MADKTVTGGGLDQDIPMKWHDNGDSTFSPVFFDGGSSGGGTSAVNVSQVGGVAVSRGAGNADTGTLRVVLPFDQGVIPTSAIPTTIGGLLISRTLSAATTNSTNVKGSVGQVYGWYLFNANAAVRYLKLYNKATAPTVGTDTPVMTIPIPAGAAANVEYANGIAFATGIGLALTTGVTDADTGAVALNEIIINLLYK